MFQVTLRSGVLSLIILMTISCGTSIPARKHQLTKADLQYKTDTKTLEKMLAELMDIRDEDIRDDDREDMASSNQAINCIQRTPEHSTTEVTLSLDRLNEILGSLTGGSNKTYILTNDRSIYYDDANNNEAFLYNTLRNDYKTSAHKETPTQIWINKAPCPICVNNLDDAFKDRPTQPTIYVETFDYTEATYGKLLESFGCLAKLQNLGYPVRAWNWSTFKAGLQNTDECPTAINTQTASSNYMAAKSDLERYIGIFSELASDNTVVDWCQN